jgi:hypothetical protein
MSSGYWLDFTNRTFAEFVVDSVGLNIFDARFDFGSGSKANRLQKLWETEDDAIVAKLMTDVLNYGFPVGLQSGPSDAKLESLCRQTVTRLLQGRTAASSFDTKAGAASILRAPYIYPIVSRNWRDLSSSLLLTKTGRMRGSPWSSYLISCSGRLG